MAQRIKRVFDPPVYEISIGGNVYEVVAQPIEKIIEFQVVVEGLFDSFGNLGPKYYVVANGNGRIGPFETEALAQAEAGDNEIEIEQPGIGDYLHAVIDTPYPALKVVIPTLVEDHVHKASLPELKIALDTIIEANGINWFESFVKKTIGPMVPQLIELVVEETRKALISSTMTRTAIPGETPLTES